VRSAFGLVAPGRERETPVPSVSDVVYQACRRS
jgi:hypothetical protein